MLEDTCTELEANGVLDETATEEEAGDDAGVLEATGVLEVTGVLEATGVLEGLGIGVTVRVIVEVAGGGAQLLRIFLIS